MNQNVLIGKGKDYRAGKGKGKKGKDDGQGEDEPKMDIFNEKLWRENFEGSKAVVKVRKPGNLCLENIDRSSLLRLKPGNQNQKQNISTRVLCVPAIPIR